MKTKNNLVIFLLLLGTSLLAKEYKMDVSKVKSIEITMLANIKIVASNGTQLRIESDVEYELPERAKGLKPIYTNGTSDNTGVGLSVTELGTQLIVLTANKAAEKGDFTFYVPSNIALKINYDSPFAEEKVEVIGMKSEVDIRTLHADISMKEVNGPVVINTINGEINIEFSTINQNSPTSISSINGPIDVSLPSTTSATISLGTLHGEIFTDFDLEFEKKDKDNLKFIGGNSKILGKINNGGVQISLKTINENIYLRKSK